MIIQILNGIFNKNIKYVDAYKYLINIKYT